MVSNKFKKKILSQVKYSFEEQSECLSKIVSIHTLPGQEADGQRYFAQLCRDSGLDVELFEPDKRKIISHPAYIETELDYSNRPNVIARLRGEETKRSLILNGHMDVVSPEPASMWTMDPWGGQIKEGRLYGRGALDMKAGLCANLFALRAILDCGFRPRGEVILESVIEEELGGSGGTLACFLRGLAADGMVVSEPSNHQIWITSPGIKYFRITVHGLTAHAALSHRGINAISKMIPIIKAIEELDKRRAESLSFPRVEENTGRSCNLSMGKLIAGDWVSTVAGKATLECRIGFVPGETGKQVKNEVERAIRDAITGDEWLETHPPQIEWFGWDTEPWVEPEDSLLVDFFSKSSHEVLGFRPKLTGCSGGIDSRFGCMFETPSIAFGPQGDNFHGIDECVSLKSLLNVTKTFALFIADWCELKE